MSITPLPKLTIVPAPANPINSNSFNELNGFPKFLSLAVLKTPLLCDILEPKLPKPKPSDQTPPSGVLTYLVTVPKGLPVRGSLGKVVTGLFVGAVGVLMEELPPPVLRPVLLKVSISVPGLTGPAKTVGLGSLVVPGLNGPTKS